MRSVLLALVLSLAGAGAVHAQHATPGGGLPASTAPAEAAQYDFLIGQWELLVKPKASGLAAMIHGTPELHGLWKAWRAFDGRGIDDELRIIDGSGNPMALNHSMRVYSQAEKRWNITGIDAYRARVTSADGQWQDGEMHQTGRGTDAEGKPVVTRTRFFEIAPDSFRMQQDRSSDDGQTWDEAVLTIEATRVGATAAR